MMVQSTPILAVTGGDPCGIGPEVILKALASKPAARLVVIGDLEVFERAARAIKQPLPRWRIAASAASLTPDAPINFIQVGSGRRFRPGQPDEHAGRAALAYLDAGIELCRRGVAQGLVTAPVTKWAIQRSVPSFVGQTEYFARAFATPRVAMMFVSDRLRVVLLTRHIALRDVPRRATRALLRDTIDLAVDGLRRQFGIRSPRVAVCGLNPHAGEGGLFGAEERSVLLPVQRAARRAGLRVDGPFAADGFFTAASDYDAVICWYHDQGLIPFKLQARDQGCQLTIGLPVVRTSPDHGSALDIAGQGVAQSGSMRYALRLAASIASKTPRRSA